MQKIDNIFFYFYGFFAKTFATIDKIVQKGYTRLKRKKKGNGYGKIGDYIAGAGS